MPLSPSLSPFCTYYDLRETLAGYHLYLSDQEWRNPINSAGQNNKIKLLILVLKLNISKYYQIRFY